MGAKGIFTGFSVVKGLFDVGTHIYDSITYRKRECTENELRQAYQRKVEELRLRENQIVNKGIEYEAKIRELETKMQQQMDYQEKMRIKKEKEELENQKKEEEKKRNEIHDKIKAINNCKETLSYEFQIGILNAIKDITIEQEKWINQLE